MISNPKVSIVIPSFNGGRMLRMMLDSICRQTYQDWELLVVDDGSTDSSDHTVEEFSEKDSRVKLLRRTESPKGGQKCRNMGYANAKGEYVCFFDADDLIAPVCLEQRVRFMDGNPDIDFGIFPAQSFFSDTEEITITPKSRMYGIDRGKDVLSSFLRSDYQYAVWTNMYRREAIKDIHWDERVLVRQDLDFNITCLFKHLKYRFCEGGAIDYYYRHIPNNTNSVCASFVSAGKAQSQIYLFDKILNGLERGGYPKHYKKDLKQYVFYQFERLLFESDGSCMNDYLDFCKVNYGQFFTLRLKNVNKIVSHISGEQKKKGVGYILLFLSFWNKRYLNSIKRNL